VSNEDQLKLCPINEPLVINAITSRLRTTAKITADKCSIHVNDMVHTIHGVEVALMLDIIEAAVAYMKEKEPTDYDKSCGFGGSIKVAAAEQKLFAALRSELPRNQ
jgi:hypothetical protein